VTTQLSEEGKELVLLGMQWV